MVNAAAVVAAHESRLARLDPLLPAHHPLPPERPQEDVITVPGAVGYARHNTAGPDGLPYDQYRLVVRIGDADPVAAMDAALTRWHERVAATARPDDPASAAVLAWPSRDVGMVRLFLDRGLVPLTVLAARPAARGGPLPDPRLRLRRATPGDLDAVVDLHLAAVRWDSQFGGTMDQWQPPDRIWKTYRTQLAVADPWVWLAEVDTGVAGLLVLAGPPAADWVAQATGAHPVAYLSCLMVTEPERGGGLGAALVAHAHEVADRAGVRATLLHYSGLNPLSAPFWHRCGYRPLWTEWGVRPASRLRG